MKKYIYVCNRCGREIQGTVSKVVSMNVEPDTGKTTGAVMELPEGDDDRHYCLNCVKNFFKEAVSDGQEPEKKDKRTKKKLLDIGKIMALHKAGWSNQDIAGEVGATEKQVYQCIYHQNKKASEDEKKTGGGG